jgi:hypothetical protein
MGMSHFGAGDKMGWVQNWGSCITPSSSTGRPVLGHPVRELGVLQKHFKSSSRTGCPKLTQCPFGGVMVPVPELSLSAYNVTVPKWGPTYPPKGW